MNFSSLLRRNFKWLHSLYHINRLRLTIITSLLILSSTVYGDNYQIGVYYFPGWKDEQVGAPASQPWERIKAFPERIPALGWYDEGSDHVMWNHIEWMQSYGIDFVVFDWYFGREKQVMLEHALAAYMRAPNRTKLKFSILWANHNGMPKSINDWHKMVRYWVRYYFPRPEFLLNDGHPVVFVFSAEKLRKQAESFGTTTKKLIDDAQVLAREEGLPGIYFVAGTGAYLPMIENYAKDAGYSAFSAYNYHQGPVAPYNTPSHSFAELDKGYQAHWQRFAAEGSLPLIVPMTSGWDMRPWGGSKDPFHDNSLSTPSEFRKHLSAAKMFMNANPNLTQQMGVICCWNEFGEGSFIEPTMLMGTSYLEQVENIFGSEAQ